VGKREGKILLENPKRWWEDSNESVCFLDIMKDEDWIDLARNMDRGRSVANTAMKFRVL
jgi:hypothetical protein